MVPNPRRLQPSSPRGSLRPAARAAWSPAPPGREEIAKSTPGDWLRAVLKDHLSRPGFGEKAETEKEQQKLWYWCTRHTFASQWVMAGGSIEKLKEILGHYSVSVTERYAHLKPELFTAKDLGTISLDLASRTDRSAEEWPADGQCRATCTESMPRKYEKKGRSRPVSRVLFRRKPGGGDHSSRTRVAARLQRATRRPGPDRPCLPACADGTPPYSLLHRVGFAVPPRSPGARCALTAPFHPCHARPPVRSS